MSPQIMTGLTIVQRIATQSCSFKEIHEIASLVCQLAMYVHCIYAINYIAETFMKNQLSPS